VVSWNCEEWDTDPLEQLASTFELGPTPAVRQVAGDHEDLRGQLGHQLTQSRERLGHGVVPEMEIRDVENPSDRAPLVSPEGAQRTGGLSGRKLES
jgi:hypothetical protein